MKLAKSRTQNNNSELGASNSESFIKNHFRKIADQANQNFTSLARAFNQNMWWNIGEHESGNKTNYRERVVSYYNSRNRSIANILRDVKQLTPDIYQKFKNNGRLVDEKFANAVPSSTSRRDTPSTTMPAQPVTAGFNNKYLMYGAGAVGIAGIAYLAANYVK